MLKALQTVKYPGQVLEIGCEGGRWSMLLSQLGWKVTCTDTDQRALGICQRRIPDANCVLVSPDETRLPCDGDIDLLLCLEVVDVIQSDWFIREASRVLTSDGLVVAVFYNLLSLRGLFYRLANAFRKTKHSYYRLPYQHWRKKLCQAGFSMVYQEGFCWFPFRRNSDSPLVPPATRMERLLGLNRFVLASPWVIFIAGKN
jgi:SAM-dependent methyltransferase